MPKGKSNQKSKKVSQNVKTYVKKVLDGNVENKFSVTQQAFAIPATNITTQFSLLGSIPQGTADNNRIGDKIKLKSLHVKGTAILTRVAGTDNYSAGVRIVICRIKVKQTPSIPSFAGAANGYVIDTNASRITFAARNPTTKVIYEKLYDKVTKIHVGSVNDTGYSRWGCNIKLDKLLHYEQNTTNVNKGDIVLFVGTDVILPNNTAGIQYQSILYYEDA